jgi:transposase-like protein
MRGPHCGSATTQEQAKRASLGYRTFRCVACRLRYNEQSGTPFNNLSVPIVDAVDHRAVDPDGVPERSIA